MNWKIMAGGVLAVLFLVACFFLGGNIVEEEALEEGGEVSVNRREPAHVTNTVTKMKRGKRDTVASSDRGKEQAPRLKPTVNLSTNTHVVVADAEKRGLDALQLALDEEQFDKVRDASAQLARSSSPYVRGKVVEALSWFKQRAIPDLRGMMNDSDEEVASDATDAWLEAVASVTDEALKAKELYAGMVQIQDMDSLHEAMMEYYDMDDGLALQYIVNLIHSGNPAARQAGLEGYEHVAGDPYTTPEAAQTWIDAWRRDHPLDVSMPENL
jgi:ribosome modulation factor